MCGHIDRMFGQVWYDVMLRYLWNLWQLRPFWQSSDLISLKSCWEHRFGITYDITALGVFVVLLLIVPFDSDCFVRKLGEQEARGKVSADQLVSTDEKTKEFEQMVHLYKWASAN